MGHAYAKNIFIIYLKLKCNRISWFVGSFVFANLGTIGKRKVSDVSRSLFLTENKPLQKRNGVRCGRIATPSVRGKLRS